MSYRQVIVVGSRPGRDGDHTPLSTECGSGRRLGLLLGDGINRTSRVNLCPSIDGGTLRGGSLNLQSLLRGRRVVALGRDVAIALGIDPTEWFQWGISRGSITAVSPHPSGRSRWWNVRENTRSAERFYRGLLLPCVHIEGPDGSGKSTLCRQIVDRTPLRMIDTEDPPQDWGDCLSRIRRRIVPGIACDRSSGLISELVYGPVIRGRTIGGEDRLWDIVRSILLSTLFIYCRPERLFPSFRSGESLRHVRKVRGSLHSLMRRYDLVMGRIISMGGCVIRYNYLRDDIEEILRCVESP